MTHHIGKDQYFFGMSKENEAKLTVDLGDTVLIEADDAFNGQIKSASDSLGEFDWNKVNQATGPIYINGVGPGDVLKVKIHSIDVADHGVMMTGPGLGVTGDLVEEMHFRKFDVDNEKGTIDFDGIELPMNKMIGVIGVAPPEGTINNGTPDTHGGNMDSVKVAEGATLYLPVFHEGALFGLGDCHGAMADGEICVTGLEVAANVKVTFEKAEHVKTDHPMIVDEEGAYMFVSDESLDKAVDESVLKMIELIRPYTNMPASELTMLMSLAGHTQINQVVDPKKTARFFVPHAILEKLNVKLG